MRQVVSTFLIFILSFPQLLQGFAVVHYILYQDYIEAEFCENIDKPELECHGSCHLNKEIAAIQNTDEQNESDQKVPSWQSFSEFTCHDLNRLTQHTDILEEFLPVCGYKGELTNPNLQNETPPPKVA